MNLFRVPALFFILCFALHLRLPEQLAETDCCIPRRKQGGVLQLKLASKSLSPTHDRRLSFFGLERCAVSGCVFLLTTIVSRYRSDAATTVVHATAAAIF